MLKSVKTFSFDNSEIHISTFISSDAFEEAVRRLRFRDPRSRQQRNGFRRQRHRRWFDGYHHRHPQRSPRQERLGHQ